MSKKPTRLGRPVKPRDRINCKVMKEARWKADLSFGALAHLVGVSTSTVVHWEGGTRRPSEDQVAALAKALNITEDKLWK